MDIQKLGERILNKVLTLILLGFFSIILFPPPFSFGLIGLAVIGLIPYTAYDEMRHMK